MRERMTKVGFMPPASPRRFDRPRPTRAREVLSKFGVAPPKVKKRLPPSVQVGAWRRATREITPHHAREEKQTPAREEPLRPVELDVPSDPEEHEDSLPR